MVGMSSVIARTETLRMGWFQPTAHLGKKKRNRGAMHVVKHKQKLLGKQNEGDTAQRRSGRLKTGEENVVTQNSTMETFAEGMSST